MEVAEAKNRRTADDHKAAVDSDYFRIDCSTAGHHLHVAVADLGDDSICDALVSVQHPRRRAPFPVSRIQGHFVVANLVLTYFSIHDTTSPLRRH